MKPGIPGKWPTRDLARLLRTYAPRVDGALIVGPAVGEDAAVDRAGSETLVIVSDPVTFAAESIGAWSVLVNANDVAATGAEPRLFVAVALLPVEMEPKAVEAVFADLADACEGAGVLLVGGHTERTAGLARPIVVGTMIGLLEDRAPLSSGGPGRARASGRWPSDRGPERVPDPRRLPVHG